MTKKLTQQQKANNKREKRVEKKSVIGSNPNIGPRTEAARKAVILMNRIKHRPKSVITQSHDEVVVQVRGDFDHLVKKLCKLFKIKGKDTSMGRLRQHDWRVRGYGIMGVYYREGNTFCSVRFKNIPGFGIKVEPEPEEPDTNEIIAAAAARAAQEGNDRLKAKLAEEAAKAKKDEVPEDLDSVLLD